MTTVSDVLDECEDFLLSHTNDKPVVTALTSPLDSSSLTLSLADGVGAGGFVQIDSELMAVRSFDQTAKTITLHAWGRAQRGSVAAAHVTGSRVTVNPRFPRASLLLYAKAAVVNLYPELFQVALDTSHTSTLVPTYSLPATAEDVVRVDWKTPLGMWLPLRHFSFDPLADTSQYATGKTVTVGASIPFGRPLKVAYVTPFTSPSAETDTLVSLGVPDDWRDILRYEVVANQLMSLDSARMQNTTSEAQRTNMVPVASAQSVARSLLAYRASRVVDERRRLLNLYRNLARTGGV